MINNDISFPKPWWNRVNQGLNRRPSALLLVGPKGIGKTGLAIELAASWLCQSPLEDGSGWFLSVLPLDVYKPAPRFSVGKA